METPVPDWLFLTITVIVLILCFICFGFAVEECRKRLKSYFKLSELTSYLAAMFIASMPALLILVFLFLPNPDNKTKR